ncbi:MAG: hypothetical protein HY735_13485 [Verrucomicrobia bacterium]|nr:hypothetical protein [Verrucomicrobiota bacterium]
MAWEGLGWYPRVRTYTMNALLDSVTVPHLKTSSLHRPSQVFLFLDEREDSIEDCKFKMILDYGPDKLAAIPGSYHNGSACFSFADGHAEKHRWLDRRTNPLLNPRWRIGIPWVFPPGPLNSDVLWLREHAAYWENPVFDESM